MYLCEMAGATYSNIHGSPVLTAGHVHKYEAVFGSFVDIGIVATFLSFTWILSFRLWNNPF